MIGKAAFPTTRGLVACILRAKWDGLLREEIVIALQHFRHSEEYAALPELSGPQRQAVGGLIREVYEIDDELGGHICPLLVCHKASMRARVFALHKSRKEQKFTYLCMRLYAESSWNASPGLNSMDVSPSRATLTEDYRIPQVWWCVLALLVSELRDILPDPEA